MNLDEIRADLAAFADDEDSIQLENGFAIFSRDRTPISCQFIETPDGVSVEIDNRVITYKQFIGEVLGRMSVLAQALIDKRPDVSPYIDTEATLVDSYNNNEFDRSGLKLLQQSSTRKAPGETKLIFLTADAGHGKTALLRRLTRNSAESYLRRESDHLLFHIDTQGRSFVRLEEAIARDLGQLRIFGLFYPGVIRLVRRNLIALAIDGFDELLAEIGVGEAYSGLGSLLRQLHGDGVLIASARSAYFEVENYSAQTRLLTSSPDSRVSVSQIRLERWQRQQTTNFFRQFKDSSGRMIAKPNELYNELSQKLGIDHPVLHRPFLVQRLAALLAPDPSLAEEIADEINGSRMRVVFNVVQALLKREVEEKWRDPNGQAYLTVDQHIILLSAIADEMWTQGRNSLSVETVQLITETVLDIMSIPTANRVQVVQRIRAHALLPITNGELSFQHEEIQNVFLGLRCREILDARDRYAFQKFCEARPLPPTVARLAAGFRHWENPDAQRTVDWMTSRCRDDIRSNFIRQNCGSLTACIAGSVNGGAEGFVMGLMFFEGQYWNDVALRKGMFHDCTFIGVDFSSTSLLNCVFEGCQIDGLIVSEQATSLEGCRFTQNNIVVGVLAKGNSEEVILKSYVPEECRELLERIGATFEQSGVSGDGGESIAKVRPRIRKVIDTYLRIFTKNTGVNTNFVRIKLGARYPIFESDILPALRRFSIIADAIYSGGGQQERWELRYSTEEILRAEDPQSSAAGNLRGFWDEMRLM